MAGEPHTDDVLDCQLKPLNRSDYLPVTFTDAQWQELQQAFPNGVGPRAGPGAKHRRRARARRRAAPAPRFTG